jgi:hypothetical protein
MPYLPTVLCPLPGFCDYVLGLHPSARGRHAISILNNERFSYECCQYRMSVFVTVNTFQRFSLIISANHTIAYQACEGSRPLASRPCL